MRKMTEKSKGEFVEKFKVMGTFVRDNKGRKFREERICKYIKFGSKLVLTREPDNPKDPNAIMVNLPVRGGAHMLELGYVPKELAAQIAPRMDAGEQFRSTFRTKIINEKTGGFIALYLNLIKTN
jgi:HIRAN domain